MCFPLAHELLFSVDGGYDLVARWEQPVEEDGLFDNEELVYQATAKAGTVVLKKDNEHNGNQFSTATPTVN